MIDWLVFLGLQGAVGFVFKDVLLKLLQGSLEDYVKDFFKQAIGDLVALAQKEPLHKALGLALKEFLVLAQTELQDAEVSEARLERFKAAFRRYLQEPIVRESLGIPLCKLLGRDDLEIDLGLLQQKWIDLGLEPLPESFNWLLLSKRYTRKAETIVKELDGLRQLFDSTNLARMRQILEENASVAPGFDFSKYQEKLRTAYTRLRLDTLDTSGWTYRLQLENMFMPQRIRVWPKDSSPSKRPATALLASNGGQRIVILGNPGSGKSTLLQYKALRWTRLSPSKLAISELPLLIELRNYIDNVTDRQCRSLLNYLHEGMGVVGGNLNQQQLNEWLLNRKTLLMLDGLDEILDQGSRHQVIEDIINFTHDYPQVRVVVTSRMIGYEPQRFQDASFCHYVLQDLDQQQVTAFLRNWHRLAFENQQEGEQKRERLQQVIETSPAFGELAGNPLLLTMMAILNRNEKLPKDRPTLYERASEVLLHRWDGGKDMEDPNLDARLKTLDYKDKQEMLRQVAYYMYNDQQEPAQSQTQNLLIRGDDLVVLLSRCLQDIGFTEPRIAAKALLYPLTTRSFILNFMGGDSYGFVHRTFQEYFCAWHIVRKFEKHQEITLEILKAEYFCRYWQDETWHEILCLIAGRIEGKFAGKIIDRLLEEDGTTCEYRNVILAAKCLGDVRNPFAISETASTLRQHLERVAAATEVSEAVRQAAQWAISAHWGEDGTLLVN